VSGVAVRANNAEIDDCKQHDLWNRKLETLTICSTLCVVVCMQIRRVQWHVDVPRSSPRCVGRDYDQLGLVRFRDNFGRPLETAN